MDRSPFTKPLCFHHIIAPKERVKSDKTLRIQSLHLLYLLYLKPLLYTNCGKDFPEPPRQSTIPSALVYNSKRLSPMYIGHRYVEITTTMIK